MEDISLQNMLNVVGSKLEDDSDSVCKIKVLPNCVEVHYTDSDTSKYRAWILPWELGILNVIRLP